jgi:hypothetical protein
MIPVTRSNAFPPIKATHRTDVRFWCKADRPLLKPNLGKLTSEMASECVSFLASADAVASCLFSVDAKFVDFA